MFRDVTIRAVANGFVVTVSCQTFVFQESAVLLKELGEYLDDPDKKEQAILKTAKNLRWLPPIILPPGSACSVGTPVGVPDIMVPR